MEVQKGAQMKNGKLVNEASLTRRSGACEFEVRVRVPSRLVFHFFLVLMAVLLLAMR